jgi:hypothetical protein
MIFNATESILDNIGVPATALAEQLRRYLANIPAEQFVILVGEDEYSIRLFGGLAKEYANVKVFRPSDPPSIASKFCPTVVIYCQSHFAPNEWERASEWETTFRDRFKFIWTLMQDRIVIRTLSQHFQYFKSIEETLETYRALPDGHVSPLIRLNVHFPIRGKRVVEYGCLDAVQTACLVHLKALDILALEFRPENFVKAAVAKTIYRWDNVHLLLEPYQFATAGRLGTFDICVFQGVYYHTNDPFSLLRNAIRLAPVIFFGGFVANENTPDSSWVKFLDGDWIYKGTKHHELNHIASGVTEYGYFLSTESILAWFDHNGFEITGFESNKVNISIMPHTFVSFLAKRRDL